jgi:plasmid stability protein
MNTITIDLSPETYQQLEAHARRTGQALETVGRELLEMALQAEKGPQPRTAREVLQVAGRIRPLSPTLRNKIIPDVTLEEVRTILSHATGPSLSAIIDEQRGAKS